MVERIPGCRQDDEENVETVAAKCALNNWKELGTWFQSLVQKQEGGMRQASRGWSETQSCKRRVASQPDSWTQTHQRNLSSACDGQSKC